MAGPLFLSVVKGRDYIMKKNKIKIVLIVLIALVVIASSMGFGYFIAKHPAEKNETTKEETSEITVSESTDETEATEESTNSQVTENITGEEKNDKNLLLGKWNDNANFSGYEFFDNGTMKVTYFNMAAINLEDVIEGTYTGTYSVEDDKLSISYTIYSKAITKNYTFTVDENTLTLSENGETAIYVREGAQTVMENVDKKLLGKWSSNLSGFEFKDTGVVSITFIDLGSMGINIPINGTVDGIYTVDGDEVTIKYSIYTGVIEKTYKYSVNKDVLTMTELGTNKTGTYIRKN